MKIRTGFVSNSSSSSFTCDVCGNTESGYDMTRSDAGMQECSNGHTFCESHEVDATYTLDEMRSILIKEVEGRTWQKRAEKDADIKEIQEMTESALEEHWDEWNGDDGCHPGYCPLCQMTDLDYGDAVSYALIKLGYKSTKELAKDLKKEFGDYDAFQKWLKENREK